jgi:hypothetical protein
MRNNTLDYYEITNAILQSVLSDNKLYRIYLRGKSGIMEYNQLYFLGHLKITITAYYFCLLTTLCSFMTLWNSWWIEFLWACHLRLSSHDSVSNHFPLKAFYLNTIWSVCLYHDCCHEPKSQTYFRLNFYVRKHFICHNTAKLTFTCIFEYICRSILKVE